MLIEHHTEEEVRFAFLDVGAVFTTREGAAHLKIKEWTHTDEPTNGDDSVTFRFNAVALASEPWATWIDDGTLIHHHPDAALRLGPVGEPKA